MLTWLQSQAPLILIGLGGIVAASGALWAEHRAEQHRDAGKKKSRAPAVVIFLGTAIGLFGGYWAGIQESKFQEELLKATGENLTLSKEISSKSDAISDLNRQIADLSQENLKWATGGNGYCYLAINQPADNGTGLVPAVLIVKGKYPLREVHIQVTQQAGDYDSPWVFDHEYGTLPPDMIGRPEPGVNLRLPASGHATTYVVSIATLSAVYAETISFKKVNGTWLSALRVFEQHSQRTIFVSVEKDFPRDARGQVLW